VHFRVLPHRAATKHAAATIVLIAGGPGQPSSSLMDLATQTFGPLLGDHDVLLVDNRGTGASSAVNCPSLQTGLITTYGVDECKSRLGAHANDYGTIAAVDDLHDILTMLHPSAVDLYGVSYGSFFAQVFAQRYPQGLERLVLDGAVPLDEDPWGRDVIPTALNGLRDVCRSDPVCHAGPDPVTLLERVTSRVRRAPKDDPYSPSPVTLAQTLTTAGLTDGSAYRELPAALRSYLAGDKNPLVRLMDEHIFHAVPGISPSDDSFGLLIADTCADEPQAFDLHESMSAQIHDFDSAERSVGVSSTRDFSPFTLREADPLAPKCLGWPAPAAEVSRRETTKRIPTLVIDGALDTVTPPDGAEAVAKAIPGARFVEVPFVGHVTAGWDHTGCAAHIIEQFVATTEVDHACLGTLAPLPQVDAFPTTFSAEAPIAAIHRHAAPISPDARRALGVVRDAIADVLWRWDVVKIDSDHGLRGGSFTVTPDPATHTDAVSLDGIRWTSDTTVTGTITVTRGPHPTMTGTVAVSTPAGHGRLTVSSSAMIGPHTTERLRGSIGQQRVDVIVDAKLGLF
jgi:pimeloyl-ACP methyl ester carboxylesterase